MRTASIRALSQNILNETSQKQEEKSSLHHHGGRCCSTIYLSSLCSLSNLPPHTQRTDNRFHMRRRKTADLHPTQTRFHRKTVWSVSSFLFFISNSALIPLLHILIYGMMQWVAIHSQLYLGSYVQRDALLLLFIFCNIRNLANLVGFESFALH